MKKFCVAIIDDNDLCIKSLEESLSSYPNVRVVGVTQTASEGKSLIQVQHPDLLFLDVELPDSTGLELLREVRYDISWPMQVVFYTAYDKYLLDALRESAFDYLLKPYSREELDLVMNRFFVFGIHETTNVQFRKSIAQLLPQSKSFIVSTLTGFQILQQEQIGYFTYQGDRKQWMVVLTDKSQHMLKRNTCASDILLYSSAFIQINQHQIININYLAMISDKQCVLYPPFESVKDLSVSRSYYNALQERFCFI